jgi:hypothetical protein
MPEDITLNEAVDFMKKQPDVKVLVLDSDDDFKKLPPFDVVMGARQLTTEEIEHFKKTGRHLWWDEAQAEKKKQEKK